MAATLLAALLTCLGALFLGQAALRLSGAREWNWLAPAVGISVIMLVASPAYHVPGRALTMAILLALLTVAAAVWCLREPAQRPPLADLATALPVAALLMIPFLAVDHSGILGTSLNNDMSVHLLFVEGYVDSGVSALAPLPSDYPLGPHATAALLTKGLGIEAQQAFSGWTIAIPVLNAWVALAAARRASWPAKVAVATVVGLPFLVAAYYGQGAFKEIAQAGLVLAAVLSLAGFGPHRLGRGRWVPLALLLGGMVSVYSITGLPWPLFFLAIWLAGVAIVGLRSVGARASIERARAELPAIGIGVAVFVVTLLPQIDRVASFAEREGTGIARGDLGNLVGPLPGWEAFGTWGNADFRLPDTSAFGGPPWTALIVAFALIGSVWAIRRGRWLLPLSAGGGLLIWWISNQSQSPYVSAKALVIVAPLLLLCAVMPLTERAARKSVRWWTAPVIGLVVLAAVGASDVRALRISPVGPVDHAHELESLRPQVEGHRVLFLGLDDFAGWELAGAEVHSVVFQGGEKIATRPRKEWEYELPLDLDSVTAAVLNEYEWIVAPRDLAGSEPPRQLKPVAATRNYVLYRRDGVIPERAILDEGPEPGRRLDCRTPAGRAIAAQSGVAAVRAAPVVVPGTAIPAGGEAQLQIALPRGSWELLSPYTSPLPIDVNTPGLTTTLPPSLDRPGNRWPIGTVRVGRPGTLTVDLKVEDAPLAPSTSMAVVPSLIAVRSGGEEIVPLHQACGRYLDWYRAAGQRGGQGG